MSIKLRYISTVIKGQWGAWGWWGSCSMTECGWGHRRRARKCNKPTPLNGGSHCSADGSSSSKIEMCRGKGVTNCPSNGKVKFV